jgi:uncharacterized protein DUF6166
MTCKTYIGTPHRDSVSGQSLVTVCDGQKSEPLPLRLDLFNHSPTGFGWGYGGSGPAQLALALLADSLGDNDRAIRLHQDFKFKVVAFTSPLPTGSAATAKTIGMTDVACFAARAAFPPVTMTSTFRRTNSAAISAKRSIRPSPQRTSIATLRPSVQPSSRSRCTKAVIHGPQLEGVAEPKNPIVGSFDGCCARAASGHAAVAPHTSVMNSRRFLLNIAFSPQAGATNHAHRRRPPQGGWCASKTIARQRLLRCGISAQLMPAMGHFRQIDPLPTLPACPLRSDCVRTFAPQRNVAMCQGSG